MLAGWKFVVRNGGLVGGGQYWVGGTAASGANNAPFAGCLQPPRHWRRGGLHCGVNFARDLVVRLEEMPVDALWGGE